MATIREYEYSFEMLRQDGVWIKSPYLHWKPDTKRYAFELFKANKEEAKRTVHYFNSARERAAARRFLSAKHRLVLRVTTTSTKTTRVDNNTVEEVVRTTISNPRVVKTFRNA